MVNNKLVRSRNVATGLIKDGAVKVNGIIITKPSKEFQEDVKIEITEQPRYVGRGGLKLQKALEEFEINPAGFIALDVGSSTGGFTDCLLQQGAKKIYAIDVGTDQLDSTIKNDPRVISLEKTDIRDVDSLPDQPDLAVIDVSFISLELILKKVRDLMTKNGKIIALVKPQFETKREDKNKSGIVKNDILREKALQKIKEYCQEIGLEVLKTIDSPILGGSGNKEYLILLQTFSIV